MTYRNEILATVSDRLPLVSLLPLVRLSFESIRSVLRSDQSGAVRLFAASCVQSCRGWSDHLPVCWAGGARLRHPRGGGDGCGKDRGGRGEALGTKARKKEREQSGKALQRLGGNTTGEEADSSSLSRCRTHSRTRERTRSIDIIRGHGAPSSGGGW